jgi:endonuclease/exonuclease/phosphatase family metal-dependent hydrolase
LKIKIATYNIHRAIGTDRRFRPDRIVEVLAEHDPDIVLLQEVDEGAPRSRELDLAREIADSLSYPFYVVGHNVSLRKGRYGNATLSKYKIRRERNIDLTVGSRKRRGCQHSSLEIGHQGSSPYRLEVFNLHLGLSARERRQQIGLLACSRDFTSVGRKTACLVGGDFNDWRSLLRAFFVEELDFRCATDRESKLGIHGIKTYPSFAPQGALDRLYVRGRIRQKTASVCRHRVASVASDHLPIFAEFELY